MEGKLRFVLEVDSSKGTASLENFSGQLKQVGAAAEDSGKRGHAAFEKFTETMGNLKGAAIGLAAGFGGLEIAEQIAHWTEKVIEFQSEWAKVTTLLQNSRQFDELKDQVLSLSGELGSSTELARGLYEVLRSGIEPTKSVEFLATAAKLAQVSLTDTATAVNLLKVSLSAYGIETDKAGEVSDKLFQIMKTGGGITAPELAASLGKIIPIASGLNVPLEDLGAMLATLKERGISTGQAVMALGALMSAMSVPSSKLSQNMEQLGVDVSAARIKSEGFGAILKDIAPILEGDTELTTQLGLSKKQLTVFLSLTGSGLIDYQKHLRAAADAVGVVDEAHKKLVNTVHHEFQTALNETEAGVIRVSGVMGQWLKEAGEPAVDNFKLLSQRLNENSGFWGALGERIKQVWTGMTLLNNGLLLLTAYVKSTNAEQRDSLVIGAKLDEINKNLTKGGLDHMGALQKEAMAARDGTKAAEDLTKAHVKSKKELENLKKTQEEMNKLILESHLNVEKFGLDVFDTAADYKDFAKASEALAMKQINLGEETKRTADAQTFIAAILSGDVKRSIETVSDKIAGSEGLIDHWKNLGAVSIDEVRRMKDGINADFQAIALDASKTQQDVVNAFAVRNQRLIELDHQLGVESKATAKEVASVWSHQISTIVTDFSKGLADIIFAGKGFAETMIGIGKEAGKGFVRTLTESMLRPLTEGGLFDKWGKAISDFFSGLRDKIVNFFKGISGKEIVGIVGGLGAAIGGMKLGGVGGTVLTVGGGALTGATIGSMIMPGIGTAIGAAVGAIAGGIAAAIGHFFSKGREKVSATEQANAFSDITWKQIIPAVQAGTMTSAEGMAALIAAHEAYNKFLKDNIKNQDVFNRSIANGNVTFDSAAASLKELGKQAAIAADASHFKALADAFLQTGIVGDEFAQAIEHAGGSVETFRELAGRTDYLAKVQGEFAELKKQIDQLLPVQKTMIQNFLATGVITDEMAAKIKLAGGNLADFKKFADMKSVKDSFAGLLVQFDQTGNLSMELLADIQKFGSPAIVGALQKLIDQAKASGVSLGDLARGSQQDADIIKAAFDSAGLGIDAAFTDAAKLLSDTLGKMNDNLGAAIASLQAAMVTMINDLINVILKIPGAAEKAARDANFFLNNLSANIDIHYNVSYPTGGGGFAPIPGFLPAVLPPQPWPVGKSYSLFYPTGGGGFDPIPGYVPPAEHASLGFASGGIVTRPTRALIGEAGPEAVVPLSKAGAFGNTIIINISDVDPARWKKVTEEKILPAIVATLQSNRAGSRVLIRRALQ